MSKDTKSVNAMLHGWTKDFPPVFFQLCP